MNINITLDDQDRAFIRETITDALAEKCIETIRAVIAEVMAENGRSAAEPAGQAPAEAPAPTTDTPKEEKPAEVKKTAKAEAPAVTLEQIQAKVVQLAAAGAEKKAGAREIISAYGTKVSDLKNKPEAWADVWAKLTALEAGA